MERARAAQLAEFDRIHEQLRLGYGERSAAAIVDLVEKPRDG